MARGEHFANKNGLKTVRESLRKFLEKGFDWIALLIITIIILFTLIFF
ncbi:hypothetical protein LXL81_04145 [Dyadobacter sp. CY356]|nr:hypothetical protein [Dyadobacter sp. CY356]